MKKLFIYILVVIALTLSSCITVNVNMGGESDKPSDRTEAENFHVDVDREPDVTEGETTSADETDIHTQDTAKYESDTTAAEIADTEPPQTEAPSTESPNTAEQTTAQGIELIRLTDYAKPNTSVNIDIKGKPLTEYDIDVYYTTTISSARGLVNKVSDADGYVHWSWLVGINVKPGFYKIVIVGGGDRLETQFEVR